MVALSENRKLILSLAVLATVTVGGIVLFFVQQGKESETPSSPVIATVQGRKITEQNLSDYDRVYNAALRYQQSQDSSISLASRDETLQSLIEATLIELETGRRGIIVSENEIKARMDPNLGGFVLQYGWTEEDYKTKIRLDLLREKLEDVLTTWREAEFVAIRFDVFPEEHPNFTLEEFQAKATVFLESVRTDFSAGKSVKDIAGTLESRGDVRAVFPQNAIQYRAVPADSIQARLQRVVPGPELLSGDKHISEIGINSIDEIWCAQDACYLIRITAGNDGEYPTLKDWLNAQ